MPANTPTYMLLRSEDDARRFVGERCSGSSLSMLESFVEQLREANEAQNLVSAPTLNSVWTRHIADSAQLLDLVSRETGPWLDLGSGAGFPGLVIAMMRPHCDVVLIESRKLRIQWLEEVIVRFNLTNCRVLGLDLRRAATFDASVISARAFAPLPRLIELSARFSTNATEWVLPKGRSAEQDIAMLPTTLRSRFHVKQSVTDAEAKIIVARGRMVVSR